MLSLGSFESLHVKDDLLLLISVMYKWVGLCVHAVASVLFAWSLYCVCDFKDSEFRLES